ncbi:hypothetical protein PHJA_000625300 [Phtheirospermum japonicum]|uniref:Uncharacterized protein n=1 Tax=Phtheirospermum japonicum TaxID=374723 RepID=A0A830BLT7_9LAMI|nr:hypothetical protein PHJA_000625300 [Phtheirospermum japonicum]
MELEFSGFLMTLARRLDSSVASKEAVCTRRMCGQHIPTVQGNTTRLYLQRKGRENQDWKWSECSTLKVAGRFLKSFGCRICELGKDNFIVVLTNLESLNLDYYRINDEGMVHLAG